ncbi:hypothetical protein [Leptolyngbya sp. NIES-2104]|uniref:hypothetical protein n=1 Tax=Leptolyngbya sp. NIES-2104 TaxID=1552121 RepID=UPI0012E337ED|nr:hypothetical protein [Leptolyngbya sp. NIES-2104]
MTPTQFFRVTCSLSLLLGISFTFMSGFSIQAQIDPPPGSGAPSGTVGGGSRA